MTELRFTLLADGPSDKALLAILEWLLRSIGVLCALTPKFAELQHLRKPPKRLVDRIRVAMELYPCDLLFVHRDAETQSPEERRVEIQEAVDELPPSLVPPCVCVIPVRMTEAWLLFEESALRSAAGNPNGRMALELPRASEIEALVDPKKVLHVLLETASGLSGRRLRNFSAKDRALRVVQFLEDDTPLRALSAFSALEADVHRTAVAQKWADDGRSPGSAGRRRPRRG